MRNTFWIDAELLFGRLGSIGYVNEKIYSEEWRRRGASKAVS
jgi:hypothetical protein